MEHLFLMFLDHTQRRTTVGRTPLDEWSARRWDLYLTTHDTHNRQISMPPGGFEPTISAGERPAAVEAPRFHDNRHIKVVRLSALRTGRLYPRKYSWYSRLSQPQGHSAAGRIMSTKNSNDTIGNRTRDLPTCSAVPQPTALPRAPITTGAKLNSKI